MVVVWFVVLVGGADVFVYAVFVGWLIALVFSCL